MLHRLIYPCCRHEEAHLGLVLVGLKVLVGEESEGASDEDQRVDADAETRGVTAGLGTADWGGCGGFRGWVSGLDTE